MSKKFYIVGFILISGACYGIFHNHGAPKEVPEAAAQEQHDPLIDQDQEFSLKEEPASKEEEVKASAKLEVTNYAVQSGDTLSTIAQNHGIHVATITAENNITANTVLKIGQVLKILSIDALRYQVKSGDTLSGISKKYDIDQTEIVVVNELDENASLKVGQILFLPGAETSVVAATSTSKTSSTSSSKSSSVSSGSQTSGGITWTADALAELNKIYLPAAKPVVKAKIEAYAREHGITTITRAIYLSIHI